MYADSPSVAFRVSVDPGMLSKNVLMTARSTSVTLTEKMLLWCFSPLWYSHFEIHVPETPSQNLLLICGKTKQNKKTFRRIFKLWAVKVGKSS